MNVIVFAVYSIFYESIVWGLFGYAVFWLDRSPLWLLFAMCLSGAQLKPRHFGIVETTKEKDVDQ